VWAHLSREIADAGGGRPSSQGETSIPERFALAALAQTALDTPFEILQRAIPTFCSEKTRTRCLEILAKAQPPSVGLLELVTRAASCATRRDRREDCSAKICPACLVRREDHLTCATTHTR
jgi:hypothetical protein